MSYNVSYADYDIGDYASGDTDQASTYGEVFVERTSQYLQAECQGTTCYVACSCNTSNGWFDTPEGAKDGDTNAQVYSITSSLHRSVSSAQSLSTSSINDATADALTIGTSSMKNQTPIKASTRSDLAIDAPTIKTAAASADYLTCYKKIPCDNDAGYYSTENECRKGSQSYYYAGCVLDSSSGCYKQNNCDTTLGYYPVNSTTYAGYPSLVFSDTYVELTNGSGTQCRTVAGCNESNKYYASSSSVDTEIFTRSSTTKLGKTCYYASGCAEGYCVNGVPAYFSGKTVGTTQDGTKCMKVDNCSTPDLPYWLFSETQAPSCGLVDGAELECKIATGCNNGYGYYKSKSEFSCDYGYVTVPTEWGFPCYRCDTCPSGYFAIDPSDYQLIEFSDDVATLANGTTKCYDPIGCKGDLPNNCYNVSSSYSEMLGGETCMSARYNLCSTGGSTQYDQYYKENPTGSKVANAISFTSQTISGSTCYKATGCKAGYTETETDNDCYTYGDVTCYEKDPELKEIEFYVDTQALKESCLYYLDYTITDTSGSEYNSNTVEGKTAKLEIKCGSTIEPYTTTVYYEEPSTGHFEYTCSQGDASLESITINGTKYTDGSNMTVTVDGKSYTLPVRLGIRNTDTCMTSGCPDGYYYSASAPRMLSMTFTKHTSYPNCYKASCNTDNGWSDRCLGGKFDGEVTFPLGQSDITVSPSAIPFNPVCDSETWNDTTCYKNEIETTVCPEYYDSVKNCSTSMNYATTTPTSGSGTCYRATSCKSGYSSTGTGTSCTDNGVTCKAINGWPTDVYFTIDCNNLGYHVGTMDAGCNAAARCVGTVALGSTTQTVLDLGPHRITDNLTYMVDVSKNMTASMGQQMTFQMLTNETPYPNTSDGIDICCSTSSDNLGGAMQTQPCKRLSFKSLNIMNGGTYIYQGKDGGTITLNVSNGTTSKSSTYNVHVTYTAPNF